MSKGEHRYSTHVLEFVRNNGKSSVQGNVERGFLMFDYFDILIHKELTGEEKVYSNYFSIEDTFNDDKDYKVSFKTLSLYCDADGDGNPFVIENSDLSPKNEAILSKIPFLGLIQISLCRENYERKLAKKADAIDEFLKECENRIMEIVQGTECFVGNNSAVIQIYRSSTTGDFCLAIRTDSVRNIYKAALALNGSQNELEGFKFLTYTNVGIECRIATDKSYCTLSAEYINGHNDIKFALRFSADKGLLPFLSELHSGGVKCEAIKGLFGRYDYLLHINLEEFASIYPILCEMKFGVPKGGKAHQNNCNTILQKIFDYPNVENVNERILVDLGVDKVEHPEEEKEREAEEAGEKEGLLMRDDSNAWIEIVTRQNEELYRQILELNKWRYYFSEENRSFQDLHRGMVGIYKTFSAIGMEKEAYLNWLMFKQDMEMLCECLDTCLQNYAEHLQKGSMDEIQKKIFRRRLLKDWRINIQAINQYTRLVQNINYQTYQSPIYEIQTQIDTEKTMIAYRQAMMSYMDSYVKFGIIDEKETAHIVPIIYPDLSKDKVEVTAPFISQEKDGTYMKRAIMCTVPSFEYFGRLYDLLPWLIHESSHHLRILSREERNEFLVKDIFSDIYTFVLERSLTDLADDSLYQEMGMVGRHLIESMVDVTRNDLWEIKEKHNKEEYSFKDFDYEKMVSEIDKYLKGMFYSSMDGEEYKRYDSREIKEAAFLFYLGEYRKAEMLDESILEKILKIKTGESAAIIDELSEGLLNYYYKQLESGKTRSLETDEAKSLQDLQGNGRKLLRNLKGGHKWFESKLLEIDEKLKSVSISDAAIKEYHCNVSEVYKIINAYSKLDCDNATKVSDVKDYLEKVFDYYEERKRTENWEKKEEYLRIPATMHILRHLGLLDHDKSEFCLAMEKVFHKIDLKEVIEHKKSKLIIYAESFADLLMVTSLNFNSFGYCRQVLQTISDAQTDVSDFWYDKANIQRFQIVTAVLLNEELGNTQVMKSEKINQVKLDGSSIIEKGKVYCEYTLKCICGKLMEFTDITGNEEMENIVLYFLRAIQLQLEVFLDEKGCNETYNSTYLYILLHGPQKADPMIVNQWKKDEYEKIRSACESVKYIFWRLECFCCGIKNILQDTELVISLDMFNHMENIRNKIKKEGGLGGCVWEDEWECLARPKLDVGEFYNNPKLVYEKTSPQKLENTIEFIQNYYYYNRFKMAVKEGQNEYRMQKSNDQVC